MGVVYRATDTQLHRPVALKFVTARFGSGDQARARILREARMAAALNHPAICTIYEVGEVQPGEEGRVAAESPFEAGTPFIAMEVIEGKALDAVLRGRGRFGRDDLLDVAIPIADALAAAHSKGIVHRDLKPANVMISAGGRPKILDFGLAKLVEPVGDETAAATETESAELTRRGQVLGTVAYMSPEQAQGKPVDARSDIFSFGVMLYELAAGERPFRGDTPTSTVAKILETEPKPLGDIRSDLPGELLRIVRRCLRKKPEERFQSAGDLAVALKELKQETTSGPTQGWSDAAPVAAARPGHKALVLTISAVLVVAAAVGVIARLTRQRVAPGPQSTQRQITTSLPENALRGAAISPDGKYLAYADPTGTYLRVIDTMETHRIVSHVDLPVHGVAWLPDGTRLAVTAANDRNDSFSAWVVSILGGPPRKLRDDAEVGSVSPDGSLITFRDWGARGPTQGLPGLWVMGLDGENAREIVPRTADEWPVSTGSWSPDSRKLVFFSVRRLSVGHFRMNLLIIGRDGGPTTAVPLNPDPSTPWPGSCAWLPDGRILYTLREPSPEKAAIDLWEIATDSRTGAVTGQPRRLMSLTDSNVTRLSVTRDGKRVAFVKERRQSDVFLGGLQAGATRLENIRRLTLDERADHHPSWTRDSKSIYFHSNRQGTADVFRQGIQDRTAEVVIEGPGEEFNAQLSPDGSSILYLARPGLQSDSSPLRVMRVSVAGGPPHVVAERKDVIGFDCPRAPGAVCILVLYRDDTITFHALNPMNGPGRKIGEARAATIWSLAPDGARIAFAAAAGPRGSTGKLSIRMMNVADGTMQDVRADEFGQLTDLNWSADGKELFVVDITSSAYRLLRVDLDGHLNVLHQSERNASINTPIQSPDGRYLAFEAVTTERNAWILENF